MSGSIFKRRRKSSGMSANRPLRDDEAFLAENNTAVADGGPSTVAPARQTRPARTPSIGALSSSFGLPSRSYIHHAGHGTSGTVQYSSSVGVRQETAELSSSFLSESDMSRYFSAESRKGSETGRPPPNQRHETIEERSEPVTPEGKPGSGPGSSELSAALRYESPNEFLYPYEIESEAAASDSDARSTAPKLVVSGGNGDDEEEIEAATECSSLLPRPRLSSKRKQTYEAARNAEDQPTEQPLDQAGSWNRLGHHYPSLRVLGLNFRQVVLNPKSWDMRAIGRTVVLRPASMLPAVFLGLLLNLLDALSYGIILCVASSVSTTTSLHHGIH